MKSRTLLFAIITTMLISCRQTNKSISENNNAQPTKATTSIKELYPTRPNSKYIHTQYEYVDSFNKKYIIQNSFPKGGLTYTDAKGNSFAYFIFWSRIINKNEHPIKLAIDLPADSFALSDDLYFKILLPPGKMTQDKEQQFNYGLSDIETLLDKNLHKPSSLQKEIAPNDAHTFYVAVLYNRRIEGVIRSGLTLKEQELFYSVNKKEFSCGKLFFKE